MDTESRGGRGNARQQLRQEHYSMPGKKEHYRTTRDILTVLNYGKAMGTARRLESVLEGKQVLLAIMKGE